MKLDYIKMLSVKIARKNLIFRNLFSVVSNSL